MTSTTLFLSSNQMWAAFLLRSPTPCSCWWSPSSSSMTALVILPSSPRSFSSTFGSASQSYSSMTSMPASANRFRIASWCWWACGSRMATVREGAGCECSSGESNDGSEVVRGRYGEGATWEWCWWWAGWYVGVDGWSASRTGTTDGVGVTGLGFG